MTTSYLYILLDRNGYLSTKGSIAKGSAVEEVAFVANDDGQQWERSADDDSGYFTLKNPTSGAHLTAVTENQVTIEGMYRTRARLSRAYIYFSSVFVGFFL